MRLLAKYSLPAFIRALFSIILLSCPVLYGNTKIESHKSTDSLEIPFAFKIARVRNIPMDHKVSVPVIKLRGSGEIYSFNFLIAYDANLLKFERVEPSHELFDIPGESEWEYFTYNLVTEEGNESLPGGLVRIVAVADQANNAHRPKKYALEDSTILFTLGFIFTFDRNYSDRIVPVRFFWTDCEDNSISFRFGDRAPNEILTGISSYVFNSFGKNITDTSASFPTYYGAPDIWSGNMPREVRRSVDFYDGGVGPLHEDIDPVGDVNLNGIPCEAGDEATFFNYFLTEMGAFTINEEGQREATDLNKDGVLVSVQDYRRLQICVHGGHISDSTIFCQLKIKSRDSTLGISFDPDSSISVIWLWFYAPDATIECPDWAACSPFKGMLRLIAPFPDRVLAPGTMEIKYRGETPKLIRCDAAGPKGEKIEFNIIGDILPGTFSLSQNYPNPFNSSTSITFGLAFKAFWSLEIFNIADRLVRSFSGIDYGFKTIVWDGRDNDGNILPSGVYVYCLKAGDFIPIVWDGRDNDGNTLSSDIYVYRLEADEFIQSKKILLLK